MTLYDALSVDDDVDGYLEWVSGLMFVNRTRNEWEAFAGSDDPFDRECIELKRTIIHETYHFYQVVSTGYLYRFVTQLYRLVQQTLGEAATRVERVRALADGQRLDVPVQLGALAGLLDAPGAAGLTPRAIIESAALLYEFRAEYPAFGPRAYAEQLAIEEPPAEYRSAYDYVHRALGDGAFDVLLPIATVALCFVDPVGAFVKGVAGAPALLRRGHDGALSTLDGMRRIAEHIAADVPALGSAAEVAFGAGGSAWRDHPVYFEAVWQLNQGGLADGVLAMMIDPAAMLASLDKVMRPLHLRDRAVWLPPAAWARREAAETRQRLESLLAVAALARSVQARMLLPRPRAVRDARSARCSP